MNEAYIHLRTDSSCLSESRPYAPDLFLCALQVDDAETGAALFRSIYSDLQSKLSRLDGELGAARQQMQARLEALEQQQRQQQAPATGQQQQQLLVRRLSKSNTSPLPAHVARDGGAGASGSAPAAGRPRAAQPPPARPDAFEAFKQGDGMQANEQLKALRGAEPSYSLYSRLYLEALYMYTGFAARV